MRGVVLVSALLSACVMPSPPSTSLWSRPWPSEQDRASDGTIDLSSFPRGTGAPLRRQLDDALAGATGFGVSSGIFFPFDVPLDPSSLPSVEESTGDASVFVVSSSGARAPIDVRFVDDAGPFGGTDLLAVLPYPGIPLEPETLYLAVVTTRVRNASGEHLPPTEERLPAELDALGVDARDVAAFTIFRTADPTAGMQRAFAYADAHDRPRLESPELVETYEDYCVYAAAIEMPSYQEGRAPYLEEGGGWVWRDEATLELQRHERSRVFLTVPRTPAPPSGYGGAVFVRTGGGGDRPLVDRGPHDASGQAIPGSGLARDLARAGYLAASFDGPLEGLRNHAAWDEQFVLYDMLNPIALRDNLRQYALELALFARVMEELDLDASECSGASERARVRPGLVLLAHSNGATIAPIAAAVQPRYRALVLGGAGASWIRQSIYKESPVPTREPISFLFGYDLERQTFEHDPMLSLVQWAGEPADPAVYGRLLRERHVLVFEGVLDTYIPPPIASPVTLSLGLDLAGEAIDEQLERYRPLRDDLPLADLRALPLPVRANAGGFTRVVTQLPADGLEDGHEVMYQQPAAHRQLDCFLRTLSEGAPVVAADCAAR